MSDTSNRSRPRRRGGVVTTNACTECRKKRSKCDGKEPCTRCVTQGAECVYELPVRQTKDEMRKKIDDLEKHKQYSEAVLTALAQGDRTEELVSRLKSSDTLDDIADWLHIEHDSPKRGFKTAFANDVAREAIRNALASTVVPGHEQAFLEQDELDKGKGKKEDELELPLQTQSGEQKQALDFSLHQRPLIGAWSRTPSSTTIQTARSRGQSVILGAMAKAEQGADTEHIPPSWTKVTDNIELVEHLMALYFCWEFPTYAPLQMGAFIGDFKARRPRYCSSLLVNAMLALGCRFSHLPATKTNPEDSATSGEHFFEEAKRLLSEARSLNNLTSIQALGLMALRQASYGQDTEGYYYSGMAVRIAVEIGLHKEEGQFDATEREVRRATFWGAFTLDQCWSLNLSKIPQLSFNASFPPKPSIIPSSESAAWIPYTDQGVPSMVSAEQPSNVHSVYYCFCELSERIHNGIYRLYSPHKRLNASGLVEIYTSYMQWYDDMPDVLRLGYNFTPSVLFCHLFYHHVIITLFFPFINLRLVGSSVDPPTVISDAAAAITNLLNVYNQLYTLELTPSMTPFILLMATIGHLATVDVGEDGHERVRQSIRDLRAMGACHKFAFRALDIVRYLALEWGIGGLEDLYDNATTEGIKRSVQPHGSSTNLFVPEGELLSRERRKERTLFTVFPLQGAPLLASGGKNLEMDGFEVAEKINVNRGQAGSKRERENEEGDIEMEQ